MADLGYWIWRPAKRLPDRIAGECPIVQVRHERPFLAWHAIRTERTPTDEEYVGPGWSLPDGVNLWGVPVATTSSLALNEALVFDSLAVLLLDRQQAAVMVSSENGTTSFATWSPLWSSFARVSRYSTRPQSCA